MKKFSKKFLIYALVAVISFSSVAMTYQKAKTCKAVAVVDDIAIILASLAVMGLSSSTVINYITNHAPDVDAPNFNIDDWAQSAYEDICDWDADRQQAYLDALAKVGVTEDENGNLTAEVYGTNSDGSPDEPDDKKDPDSWKKWIKKQLQKGTDMSNAMKLLLATQCMSMVKDKQPVSFDSSLNVPTTFPDGFIESDYPYRAFVSRGNPTPAFYYSKEPLYGVSYSVSSDRVDYQVRNFSNFMYQYTPSTQTWLECGGSVFHVYNDESKGYATGIRLVPIGMTFEEGVKYWGDTLNSYSISDELAKYFEEHPNASTAPISDVMNVPTRDDILNLIKDLAMATTPDEKKNIMDDFNNKITNSDTTPTDPADPDNPSKPTDPTNPNPDGDGGGGGGTPSDPDYKLDLSKKFPFCLPYDLIACFTLFTASSDAPYIDIPIKIDFLNIDEHIIIDFSKFDYVSKVSRALFLFLFIIGLIKITRKIIT